MTFVHKQYSATQAAQQILHYYIAFYQISLNRGILLSRRTLVGLSNNLDNRHETLPLKVIFWQNPVTLAIAFLKAY